MTALLVSPDYISHYLPLSAVGSALRDAGREVVVATGAGLRERVLADGFGHVQLRLGAGSNARAESVAGDQSTQDFLAVTYEGMVATLEHQATGTIQVDGQPCRLTKYRMSNNYQTPGQRIQYSCARPNGQTFNAIEVVSGEYAWDEDVLGAEIVPGKGKATPRPALLQERLIRLWASPQGAPKAATAGGDKTTVAHDAGKPIVTFPIPGVPTAIAKATLNAQNQAERIEVRNGDVVMEFTYGKYDDYNNELNKIEAFLPGTLVEKRNGTVVRDLTTTVTETGNLYVVMPVPPSVKGR